MPVKKTEAAFGAKLRRARSARGMGVRELARCAGVHPTYVSKLEHMLVEPPEWDTILALANALESPELLNFARRALIDELLQAYEHVLGSKRRTKFSETLAEGADALIRLKISRIADQLINLLCSFHVEGGGSQVSYVSY